ncbi:hypothetical protein [Prosthecobacter sp.]|uniref:hypothetical protein n=1 Tax=Prosthecobacter sp. TaxID=1965333 RepID=UPI0026118A1A|nr:hypothetical protein [Prosthecobacter sp.]
MPQEQRRLGKQNKTVAFASSASRGIKKFSGLADRINHHDDQTLEQLSVWSGDMIHHIPFCWRVIL